MAVIGQLHLQVDGRRKGDIGRAPARIGFGPHAGGDLAGQQFLIDDGQTRVRRPGFAAWNAASSGRASGAASVE